MTYILNILVNKADSDLNSCVLNISEVLSLHECLQCKLIPEFVYAFDLKNSRLF